MHKCWSLYNKYEKLRIDDLRTDQVRTILLAIPTSKMGDWYACREGDLHWVNLVDIPDFHDDAMVLKGKDPTVPAGSKKDEMPSSQKAKDPRRPLFEDIELEAADTLKIEATPTKERRSARRYVRNLNFKISGQSFSCETRDVSMSGISLKENLPSLANNKFKAELSLEGQSLKITCSKVTQNSVRILEADGWDILRNWIINW